MSDVVDDATLPRDALDLRDAAAELDVHYQTIYRWVRSGRLPASLVGGKYLVDRSALETVRSTRETPDPPRPPAPGTLRRHADAMHTALVDGDETTARRLARELSARGTSVVDLIETVLVPPLRRIGQDWHDGHLTIWVEHRASAMVGRILADLGVSTRGRPRGTAMVAAVSGDRHSLPTSMAAAALRDANWRVHHLGADMPPGELVRFCDEHDVDVAVISSTNPDTAESARVAAHDLEEAGTPTILGRPGASLRDLLDEAIARRDG